MEVNSAAAFNSGIVTWKVRPKARCLRAFRYLIKSALRVDTKSTHMTPDCNRKNMSIIWFHPGSYSVCYHLLLAANTSFFNNSTI